MNERTISQEYKHTYARIMEIRKKESGHYIVLGDVVETSEGYIELPDQSTYNTTISRISKFNKWMSKAG